MPADLADGYGSCHALDTFFNLPILIFRYATRYLSLARRMVI
jgi:hypothetical protein